MKNKILKILSVLLLFLIALNSCTVGTSEVKTTDKDQFPIVTGLNLHGDEKTFPKCLDTKYTICVVAYQRWQQKWVDEWYNSIESIVNKSDGNTAYFEIPTISKMTAPVRWWIYKGMRGGITSDKMRSQVVTLHIDKEPFNSHLNVTDEEIVYVFVLDSKGKILYRDQGRFNEEKGKKLQKFIEVQP